MTLSELNTLSNEAIDRLSAEKVCGIKLCKVGRCCYQDENGWTVNFRPSTDHNDAHRVIVAAMGRCELLEFGCRWLDANEITTDAEWPAVIESILLATPRERTIAAILAMNTPRPNVNEVD